MIRNIFTNQKRNDSLLSACSRSLAPLVLAGLVSLAGLSSRVEAQTQKVEFASLSQGAYQSLSSMNVYPQKLNWSADRPASLKVMPKGVLSPLFATLKLGPKEAQSIFLIVLDAPANKPSRLFIDFNSDGDLSNDPKPEWTAQSYLSPKQKRCWVSTGGAMFPVRYGKETLPIRLSMSRDDVTYPEKTPLFLPLYYKSDFGTAGSLKLSGKNYHALLYDALGKGDFRGSGIPQNSGIFLWLDINGNGKAEERGELYEAYQPFNIGGETYVIQNLSEDGRTFELAISERKVKEILLPPDLAIGKPALAFEKQTMSGRTVRFPEDFKGKKALLYFWATWCGDCQRELHGVVKAYKKYHGKGLEILGATVENTNDTEQVVNDFVKDYGIQWEQIYNNLMWSGDLCQLYYISKTPTAFLIDGDTGKILASGLDLTGDQLEITLKREFATQKGSEK